MNNLDSRKMSDLGQSTTSEVSVSSEKNTDNGTTVQEESFVAADDFEGPDLDPFEDVQDPFVCEKDNREVPLNETLALKPKGPNNRSLQRQRR